MQFDLLRQFIAETPLSVLDPFLQNEFLDAIRHGDHRRWQRLVAELPVIAPSQVTFDDLITIGHPDDCDESSRELIRKRFRELIPWRKGPFSLFGIHIDSEWQSHLKWRRLAAAIEPLAGRCVLDVGSGNGYSSLRMRSAGAKLVIGLEPHIPYYGQFSALKHFIPGVPVWVLPLALEQLPHPLAEFDTVFSMGVLYHRRSPLDHLLRLADCLKPGGQMVLESLVVEGEAGYSLLPKDRYAGMSNIWFIPSVATLITWLERCGFQNVRVIDLSLTSIEEQRPTVWMPFDSLQHFLTPENHLITVEGHPAPLRAIILGNKA